MSSPRAKTTEDLAGQVQTIYLDPPYGIKFASNDAVHPSRRIPRSSKGTRADIGAVECTQ